MAKPENPNPIAQLMALRDQIHEVKHQLSTMTLLRGVHWGVARFLKARGFEWELRRSGELTIGLWRKKWGASESHAATAAAPKRCVLLPGFGDTPLSWLGVVALLTPVFKKTFDEIILLDFPGFSGFLSRNRSFHSVQAMEEHLFGVLDQLRPHTLIGHSMGGYLAAYYSGLCGRGERPRGVSRGYQGPQKMILLCPYGVVGETQIIGDLIQQGYSRIRPHLFASEPRWFRWIAPEIDRLVQRAELQQFLASLLESHKNGDTSLNQLLPSLHTETWIVWGEKDTLFPSERMRSWLDLIPENPRGVILKKLGHNPQMESPMRTALVLGQILLEKKPRETRWWQVVRK